MYKVRITTGLGYNKQGAELDFAAAMAAVATAQKALSAEFGGCTTVDGQGAWVDDNGKLVVEQVKVLEAIAFDKPKQEAYTKGHVIAAILRDSLQQQSVVFELVEVVDAVLV